MSRRAKLSWTAGVPDRGNQMQLRHGILGLSLVVPRRGARAEEGPLRPFWYSSLSTANTATEYEYTDDCSIPVNTRAIHGQEAGRGLIGADQTIKAVFLSGAAHLVLASLHRLYCTVVVSMVSNWPRPTHCHVPSSAQAPIRSPSVASPFNSSSSLHRHNRHLSCCPPLLCQQAADVAPADALASG